MRRGKYGFWGIMLIFAAIIFLTFSVNFSWMIVLVAAAFIAAIILFFLSYKKKEY
jgi:hypothetical protein